jgi:putative aminopeptidase FrvX
VEANFQGLRPPESLKHFDSNLKNDIIRLQMNTLRNRLLNKILSQPTAPFREGHVITTIQQELTENGVPHFLDPVGNLIVGANSKRQYLQLINERSSEPVRVYIAHMDHPGFHGIKWKSKNELVVKWHGGSPTQHLDGSQVWLASQGGWSGRGILTKPKLLKSGRALDTALVTFTIPKREKTEAAEKYYGGFSFRAPVWREGDLLYTKAADDLVGCFAIVSTAIDLWAKKNRTPPPFLGILTRAEEVGFIGAIGHFELGWLKETSKASRLPQSAKSPKFPSKFQRPIVCISLETSRTLPGADIGKGPVVRLGDRFTIFDPGCTKVLTDLANLTLPQKHQRRVMDGGTCEATAAMVYGYPCIGISVPLGNYHNQSFEGGPDAAPFNGPAPEFVHIQDVSGLLKLCHALLKPKLTWTSPWNNKMQEFKKSIRNYRTLMRSGN